MSLVAVPFQGEQLRARALTTVDDGPTGFEGTDGMELQPIAARAAPAMTSPAAAGAEAVLPGMENWDLRVQGSIELVLAVLRNMCEGHNTRLQTYLSFQSDNLRSIDLVAATVAYAKELASAIDMHNIHLVSEAFYTLIEYVQGCPHNQMVLFKEQIVDTINTVLVKSEFEGCSEAQVARLRLQCANVVLALLENTDAQTAAIAAELRDTLNTRTAKEIMLDFAGMGTRVIAGDDEDAGIGAAPAIACDEVAMAYYHIFRRFEDFWEAAGGPDIGAAAADDDDDDDDDGEEGDGDNDEEARIKAAMANGDLLADLRTLKESKSNEKDFKLLEKLAKESASVEILRDGQLQRVHFHNRCGVFSFHFIPLYSLSRLTLMCTAGATCCARRWWRSSSGRWTALRRRPRSRTLAKNAQRSWPTLSTCKPWRGSRRPATLSSSRASGASVRRRLLFMFFCLSG